jgi:hypothetical protein
VKIAACSSNANKNSASSRSHAVQSVGKTCVRYIRLSELFLKGPVFIQPIIVPPLEQEPTTLPAKLPNPNPRLNRAIQKKRLRRVKQAPKKNEVFIPIKRRSVMSAFYISPFGLVVRAISQKTTCLTLPDDERQPTLLRKNIYTRRIILPLPRCEFDPRSHY